MIENVQQIIEGPKMTIRHLSQGNLSVGTCQAILTKDLYLLLYRLTYV